MKLLISKININYHSVDYFYQILLIIVLILLNITFNDGSARNSRNALNEAI